MIFQDIGWKLNQKIINPLKNWLRVKQMNKNVYYKSQMETFL